MKNFKIIFFAALLVFAIGITQANAQAITDDYIGHLWVEYVAWDGTQVVVLVEGVVHGVTTPSGNMKYELHGMLPEGTPPPKSCILYEDGPYTVVITPEGDVNSTYTIKKPKD